MLPKARTAQLTIEELAEETLVFDHQRGKAHCLNGTARLIWAHCDGRTSLAQLARLVEGQLGLDQGEAVVELALEQLAQRHLLQAPLERPSAERRRSRRDLLKKMAAATLTFPVILTIAAPQASAAASQKFACFRNGDCAALEGNFGCVVGICQNNFCTTKIAVDGKRCPTNGTVSGQCLAGSCIFPPGTSIQ